MSPLQYQKRIRLQEARNRLLSGAEDAATVSFAVGYQSPSQFSREYSLFLVPRLVVMYLGSDHSLKSIAT
jgi:transcriptional regulator GlxA family with amidase domain